MTAVQKSRKNKQSRQLGSKERKKRRKGEEMKKLGKSEESWGRLLAGMKCERNAGVREICPERSLAWRRAGFVSREIWRPTQAEQSWLAELVESKYRIDKK